jgi:hypothetical protein
MTRWADTLDRPTLLVGDFNIAPLDCDVYDHKALIKVVSHTPIEIEALYRLRDAHGWTDLGRKHIPAPERNWTWWSTAPTGRKRTGPAARSHVGLARPRRAKPQPPLRRGNPPLGSTQRSRAADHGVRPVSSAARRAAQALDALRHGWPIVLDGRFTLLPAETGLGQAQAPTMLISAARAVTLKLANQREAAVPEAPVLIRGAEPFDLAGARALADPALDLTWPMKGPFLAEALDWREAAAAAMELARLAGILPAYLVDPDPAGEAVALSAADLADWKRLPTWPSLPAPACRWRRRKRRRSSLSAPPMTCANMSRW